MALHIVGGIYHEIATFPDYDVIFGSGARAGVALKQLDPAVQLTSFVGNDKKDEIEYHANSAWEIPLTPYPVPETVCFSYYHGLSNPVIRPTRLPFVSAPQITVSDTAILQFGMLEGAAVVHGERVVYDPQNPESPERFHACGSTAKELAYVLNRGEAYRLTEHEDPQQAARTLLEEPNVRVVVIKCGAEGAKVYTNTENGTVPAYETGKVWPIGSGDVFAAVFAHFWATECCSAIQAATLASRGAALYCNNRQLPLSRDTITAEPFKFQPLKPSRLPADATVYLAGPFFTMGQLWLVEEARRALLNAGFKVFSPFHDVGVGEAHEVVEDDLKGIEESHVLLALCDGLDAGTLFEVGYAVRNNTSVVAFGEQLASESMKMLRGTGCKIFDDFTSAVYHAQWEAQK